jgi:predicted aspartyl protease
MWSYNQSVQPPAPFLDVLICHPQLSERSQHVSAKLDTGADLSAIPQVVADELELLAARTILVESYNGSQVGVKTYFVILEAAQARFRLEVILILEEYALLGRDVLNHFYARLNGPDLTFDLHLSS